MKEFFSNMVFNRSNFTELHSICVFLKLYNNSTACFNFFFFFFQCRVYLSILNYTFECSCFFLPFKYKTIVFLFLFNFMFIKYNISYSLHFKIFKINLPFLGTQYLCGFYILNIVYFYSLHFQN